MKSRKEIIIETITDFVRATVAPHMQPRFDTLTQELRTAEKKSEREGMADFIRSLPKGKRKGMKPALKKLKEKGLL